MENSTASRGPRREFWVILALLGVFLTGLAALFAVPAERVLFQPQSYQVALEQQGAYERFPEILGDLLTSGGDRFLFGSGDRLREALERGNYEAVVRMIFPEPWMRAQADGLITQFWDYFNFHREDFALVVDLRPVKTRLSGDTSQEIGTVIVAGLPGCTDQDLLAFGLSALQGTLEQIPLCRPPELFEGLSTQLAAGLLQGAGAAMPEQIDLAPALRAPVRLGGEPVQRAWGSWFGLYRTARTATPWLPWLALFFLALASVLGYRTTRGSFFWLGIGLLLPGAAGALIALILWLGSAQAAPHLVDSLVGQVPVIYDVLVGMVAAVLDDYLRVVALSGLVLTVVGALLAAIAWRARR